MLARSLLTSICPLKLWMEGNCSSSAGVFHSPAISSSVGTPVGSTIAGDVAAAARTAPASQTANMLTHAFRTIAVALGLIVTRGWNMLAAYPSGIQPQSRVALDRKRDSE